MWCYCVCVLRPLTKCIRLVNKYLHFQTERLKIYHNERCSACKTCCLSGRAYFGKSLIVLQETQSLILWSWNRKDEIKTPHGHHTDLHYQKQTKGCQESLQCGCNIKDAANVIAPTSNAPTHLYALI